MIRSTAPSYRAIASLPSRFSIRFFPCIFVATLIVFSFHSGTYGNGMDVDGFLRDFEEHRGGVTTYSARFVQTKTLELFGETKVSTGSVLYKAPQRIIWKYEAPDRTQMRIERESVSFYFPELEQIEIYPAAQGKDASGLFFAFEATAAQLRDNFEISLGASEESVCRVELEPKSQSGALPVAGITLWLGRSDYLPRKILIREGSGDSTMIELSAIHVNEPIGDEEMEFDAPEGTRIIRNESGGH